MQTDNPSTGGEMKISTIYRALMRATNEKHRIAETRSNQLISNWGIGVQKNASALKWQRRDRQQHKFRLRLEEFIRKVEQ